MLIEWICFGSNSGYGNAAIDYILALNSIGVKVRPVLLDSKFHPHYKVKLLEKLRTIKGEADVQVYHMIPDMHRRMLRKKKAKKIISWAIYETTNPPDLWISILKKTDLILTPSNFCYNSFNNKGLSLKKIPHCIDIDHWKTKDNKRKKFTFLFIGTWYKRKGYDILIDAWNQLNIDADLCIKTNHVEKAKKQTSHLKNIEIVGRQNNMSEFMDQFHCVVSPNLGEAFGLVPMNALALEIPIIVTKYGGVLEYANKQNAMFINPKKFCKISCMDNLPQFREKIWPVLNSKELALKMQLAFESYPLIKKMAKKGCKEVKDMLNYDKIGNQLIKTIKNI